MIRTRRLSFQLTPLLDLLLIVIFAQYMEVRETAQQHEQTTAQQVSQLREELQAARAASTQILNDRQSSDEELAQLRQELDATRRQAAEDEQQLVKQVAELSAMLEQAREQRETVGALMTELFDIPEELVEKALELAAPGEQPRPKEDVRRIREQFADLADNRVEEMVRHLLTYDELRKRSDIWDLYITETGVISFTADRVHREFRAETASAFEDRLFEIYKSLPQPKGLVIILLSYGDARFQWRAAAMAGLPNATERMRADSNGRTRFEFANLGFRPRDRADAVQPLRSTIP